MKYLNEWEKLINELSCKEINLILYKEELEQKRTTLILEATQEKEKTGIDKIKEQYGGNNDKTRKQYVKDNTTELSKKIQNLEISIDWIKRRIEFLKGSVRYLCTVE